MKEFFRTFFAVIAGIFAIWILGVIISVVFLVSMASFGETTPVVSKNSVLKISLNEDIKEQSSEGINFSNIGGFEMNNAVALRDVLQSIRKAAKDENIKGISLEMDGGVPASISDIEEIRNELVKFRESGKFITVYGTNFTQKQYYLASAANEVYLNPIGSIDFKGLSGTLMFYKDMLDKLNVEMQIIRHGRYKSAIEPFIQNKMSEANREQVEKYLNSMWNIIVKAISDSRCIPVDQLQKYADDIVIRNAEDAVKYHFVDGLMYEDEYIALLKEKTEIKEDKDVKYISLSKYIQVPEIETSKKGEQPVIAVIYAEGNINEGKSSEGVIGSESLAKEIRKARLDKNIKAIVFRVSSPGGSAIASDIILREVKLAAAAKPTIVSMGEYAASGGYYISCGADYIFADPSTITGSIGVFSMIPNAKKLLSQKLGLHTDGVKTNKNAENISIFEPLTQFQHDIMLQQVVDIYDIFITHVSEGRNMTKEAVDAIGEGRVWLGADAKEIGLIDEFGGIEDAIAYTAQKIDAQDYTIKEFPDTKDLKEQIMEILMDKVQVKLFDVPKVVSPFVEAIDQVVNTQGVQARLPYTITIE